MSEQLHSRGRRAMPTSFRSSAPATLASPSYSKQGQGGQGKCSLMLIGNGLGAAATPYNTTFIDLIKTLPECEGCARWNADARLWTFPAAAIGALEAAMKQRMPELTVSKQPTFVTKLMNEPMIDRVGPGEAEAILNTLPAGTLVKLFPYQRAGITTAIRCGGRCLLTDEMGLGKTVQAVCVAACYPEDWPLMIVCPKSMRLQWLQELHTWLPPHLVPTTEGFAIIASSKDIDKAAGAEWRQEKRRILIISYDLLPKLPAALAYSFGVVIADESHALKEASSKRTQAAKPIMHAAKRVMLITGTPALSRPIELYPQLDMVTAGRVGSLASYGQRYCRPTRSPFGTHAIEYKGSDNIPELHALVQACGMIRRLKSDVLGELPEKQRSQVVIPPQQIQAKHRQEIVKIQRQMAALVDESSEDADFKKRLLLNSLYSATGAAKAPCALQHVKDLLQKGAKVVLFAHHRQVLDAIQEGVLKSPGIIAQSVVRIDGSTEGAARQQAVNAFQSSEQCRIALLSIMAAGVGITLTAAQVVVFAELVWTPAALVQAEDRAHRVGQKDCLQVHYLQLPGSADDVMWPVVAAKLKIVGATLDGRLTGSAAGLKLNAAAQLAARLAKDGVVADEEDPRGPDLAGLPSMPSSSPSPAAAKGPASAALSMSTSETSEPSLTASLSEYLQSGATGQGASVSPVGQQDGGNRPGAKTILSVDRGNRPGAKTTSSVTAAVRSEPKRRKRLWSANEVTGGGSSGTAPATWPRQLAASAVDLRDSSSRSNSGGIVGGDSDEDDSFSTASRHKSQRTSAVVKRRLFASHCESNGQEFDEDAKRSCSRSNARRRHLPTSDVIDLT